MNDDGQNKSVGDSSGYYVATKHTSSFMRRMVPHLFGYFPITTAWVIIIVRRCCAVYSHLNPHSLSLFLRMCLH